LPDDVKILLNHRFLNTEMFRVAFWFLFWKEEFGLFKIAKKKRKHHQTDLVSSSDMT